MRKLKYIEYNGQPVISARDFYAFVTDGYGENVTAWLMFCSGHALMEEGADFFEVKTERGHKDYLMCVPCAALMCSFFVNNEFAKEAYKMIRNLVLVDPLEEISVKPDSTSITLSEAAKILNTGEKSLFQLLRDSKILMRSNIPYQNYCQRGYFKVAKHDHTDHFGHKHYYAKTFVTVPGLIFLEKILKKSKGLEAA